MDKQYLTPEQMVARYGGAVSAKTFANWRTSAAQKGGPAFVKIGGKALYPVAHVIAWEERRMRDGNPLPTPSAALLDIKGKLGEAERRIEELSKTLIGLAERVETLLRFAAPGELA